eukprot:1240767-Amphidinium_carterae.1
MGRSSVLSTTDLAQSRSPPTTLEARLALVFLRRSLYVEYSHDVSLGFDRLSGSSCTNYFSSF